MIERVRWEFFYALENDVKASVRKQTSETCRRLRDSACQNLVFLSASARRCEKTSINSGPAARPSNFFMSTFIFNIKQGLQLASFRLLRSLSVRAIWLNIINFHDCLIPSENFFVCFLYRQQKFRVQFSRFLSPAPTAWKNHRQHFCVN